MFKESLSMLCLSTLCATYAGANCVKLEFGYTGGEPINGYAEHCTDLDNCASTYFIHIEFGPVVNVGAHWESTSQYITLENPNANTSEGEKRFVNFGYNPVITADFPHNGAGGYSTFSSAVLTRGLPGGLFEHIDFAPSSVPNEGTYYPKVGPALPYDPFTWTQINSGAFRLTYPSGLCPLPD